MAYSPSERVRKYAEELAEAEKKEKVDWNGGTYSSQVDEALSRILDRQPFSYDINADALYKQYADRYQRQGEKAMRDTIGKASAMTGGYGNSYAATAGVQAYQDYLQGLNDRIPELEGAALDRYNAEGDALARKYSALAGERDREYGEWQDAENARLLALDRARAAYESELNTDNAIWQQEQELDRQRQQQAAEAGASIGDFSGYIDMGIMTPEQAELARQAWIAKNKKLAIALGYTGRPTGGGAPKPKEEDKAKTPDYNVADAAYNKVVGSGNSKSVMADLNAALNGGDISQETYDAAKKAVEAATNQKYKGMN